MATGIRDKVAVIGMGCTRFGERFDAGVEQLMAEAFNEALTDAGIEKERIGAAWLSTCYDEAGGGKSALPASLALRLPNIPCTRVENYCASGTEAFRGAVYAVAAGACDVALAVGVEKLKDTGYGGLPNLGSMSGTLLFQWFPNLTAPGAFAQLAVRYAANNGLNMADVKRAMAHVSTKSHANGALHPKAHLRKPIRIEQALDSPHVAYPLGLFDCCGVSDGAAAAIVTTPEVARALGRHDVVSVKALQLALSNGDELSGGTWTGDRFITCEKAAAKAYAEAGVRDPARELSMMEVHDCFSITELVTMEDLGVSERGRAWRDVLDGRFDLRGPLPVQTDGGLKCFGHPIGASGLRMLYEVYNQLSGRAGERQVPDMRFGLTHNLGGFPFMNVCSVAVLGRLGD